MRRIWDDDYPEWAQRLQDTARQQAEALVPRPGCPIHGLASPALRPVIVGESSMSSYLGGARDQMAWEHITLCYGDTTAGPYVKVTTAATDGLAMSSRSNSSDPAGQLERRLRLELEPDQAIADRDRERWSDSEPAGEPAAVTRERLAMGDAVIARRGDAWAARLAGDGTEAVTVTVMGMGVAITDVRLERLPDLRDIIMARYEEQVRRIAQARRQPPSPPPPPPPGFVPAEGAAALRALADFSLAAAAEYRAGTDRHRPRPAPDEGTLRMRGALWRQAAAEYQRLSGAGARAADDAVTTAVNHLLHLQDNAPWFTSDARLREAATDETVLHAMLGVPVLSEPAQLAWNRYWSARMGGQIDLTAGDPLDSDWATGWRTAWESWTRSA